MRVLIRGTLYESVEEAATAIGVTTQTIYGAAARCALDNVGLGRKGPNGGRWIAKPFHFADREWPSVVVLAEFIGRPEKTVRNSLRGGWLAHDRLKTLVLQRIEEKQAQERQERTA